MDTAPTVVIGTDSITLEWPWGSKRLPPAEAFILAAALVDALAQYYRGTE